jgi:alpha-beta hydrolase superfamily lysophospholipase
MFQRLMVGLVLMAMPLGAQPVSAPALEHFTVSSDGHPMSVWARRAATPRGAVLFVHGLTWSGRPDFDLQVPGLPRSVLASFAAQGYAAYAIDLRGYGETPRDATGWLTPRRASADVANVLTWIAQQHPRLPAPALVGWSRGACISMLTAEIQPTAMSALVLFGFVFDPADTFADSETPLEPQHDKNTAENAASDFITPDVTPPVVVKSFVEQALKADPIHIDLKGDGEYNALKPDRVKVPTLVLFGEKDPGISMDDAGKFFAKLGTADRQMVVLPGADHVAHLEDTHDRWVAAIIGFLTRPPTRR